MTDDKVGYRRPPRSGRFKPGVSGNPKGRPKRNLSTLAQIVNDALNDPSPIANGVEQRSPRHST